MQDIWEGLGKLDAADGKREKMKNAIIDINIQVKLKNATRFCKLELTQQ